MSVFDEAHVMAGSGSKFALGLDAAKNLGLPVSRAATAAFEVANKDPTLSESDFAAIMEVAATKKKKVAF